MCSSAGMHYTHLMLCHVSVFSPVWAMWSMLGVTVRKRWWSLRMSPQHFFAKDLYLWTMLCLCCKLALPTTKPWTDFLFLMYHKRKPDSSGLNIIADNVVWDFILFCIYIFQITIVSFDNLILYFSFVLFNFLHKLWKQFCTLILDVNI